MYSSNEIIETINMVSHQHLDVRTITLGISLFDCITDDKKKTCDKIYDKIMYKAKNLVKIGEDISNEIGVPIVNKRISVTPISLVAAASKGHLEIIKTLDKAANEIGIDFLGGYSALVHKEMTPYEKEFILSIPEALQSTSKICSSVNVATTKAGINMDAIKLMGNVIKDCAYLTKDNDSIGCAKLVVFANAVEDNPFMAGAFLGSGEGDTVVNVGVSGPGVVKTALESVDGDLTEVAECIKQTAFKITRVGQLVAKEAAQRLNASTGIVDLSLAPTPVVGDSVAHILEEIGLEQVGGFGTTATLAMLNDAVKKGGIMACSSVGGLSGAFIPVSEDIGMIHGVESGCLTLEKLEAMTAVCSVGLDMFAVPGDTSAEVISAIIADEIAIGVVNQKTTAVRVIPVYGKKAGEYAEFGGLLGRAPILKINTSSPAKFINRGGRIPAPLHSFKN
ncbi:MAG: PFL family protein [Clostridiales bacterium]|nr:PFL family protein [Clostridiales bacterium]